jgi:uncharacterized delta-60 repeat protein
MSDGWDRARRVLVPSLFSLSLVVSSGVALAADGSLDPSFDADGKATTVFPGGSIANAVAVQPDGRIVAVGVAAGPSLTGDFAVARYLPDGSLDDTFDADGMLTTAIGGGGEEARSVAIQTNGRVVVAGTDDRERFAVVRYLSDGTLDDTFGGDGIVTTNITPRDDVGYDVAIQPNGKIVVAGSSGAGFAVVRYRPDGSRDEAFGGDGIVTVRGTGTGRALVLQPDGRIVVTGYNGLGLVVVRLGVRGRLDASFGGDGIVADVVHPIFPLDLALQANGKIVVVGDYDIFRVGVARFRAGGRLDRTFSGDGVRSIDFGSGEQAFDGVAILADGRIVAGGYLGPHEGGGTAVPRMISGRLMRDGTLDDTWSDDGKATARFPGGAYAFDLALQADGRVVLAGGTGPGFALARFLA